MKSLNNVDNEKKKKPKKREWILDDTNIEYRQFKTGKSEKIFLS